MLHQNIPPTYRHPIHSWEVANNAALLAISVSATDIGKVAWQQDTDEFHILLDNVAPNWGKILTGVSPKFERLLVGDMGTEIAGILVDGVNYEATAKVSDINGTHASQQILHKHSTTLQPIFIAARSNTDTSAHGSVTAGMPLFSLMIAGWAGTSYKVFAEISGLASATGTINDTSNPGILKLRTTKNGEKWPSDAVTINSDGSVVVAGAITANSQPVYTGATTWAIAFSDESTAITAGAGKALFHAPFDAVIEEVFVGLTTAQASGSTFTVDVNVAGVTILSTKITVDNTELTSLTAAVPAVLSSTSVTKGQAISVDVDAVGAAGPKGGKLYLMVRKA